MKVLLCLPALMAMAAATTPCEDCTNIVNAVRDFLTSEPSMQRQVEVLLAEVCPGADNPDECVAGLPGFWAQIGAIMWPGYYEASAEWMCGTEEFCGAPSRLPRDFTCEDCLGGIKASVEQLLEPETVAAIVDALSGDILCGMAEDPAGCATAVAGLIPAALPALAKAGEADTVTGPMICNSAMEGVCA